MVIPGSSERTSMPKVHLIYVSTRLIYGELSSPHPPTSRTYTHTVMSVALCLQTLRQADAIINPEYRLISMMTNINKKVWKQTKDVAKKKCTCVVLATIIIIMHNNYLSHSIHTRTQSQTFPSVRPREL